MTAFKNIILGKRARMAVTLPLAGGESVAVDVRPITAAEEMAALSMARAAAVAEKVTNPQEGEPIYEIGVMAAIVLVGCVDHDSPESGPVPFFDSIEQVLSLGRDTIVFLYEAQEAWQEKTSPRKKNLSTEEYIQLVIQLATAEGSEELDPFASWPRATLVSCMRTMAKQLLSSPGAKSQPTSSLEPPSKNSSARGEKSEG